MARTVQAPPIIRGPPWRVGTIHIGVASLRRGPKFIPVTAGSLPVSRHDGLVCITLGWTHQEFRTFRADIASNYRTTLDLAPSLAARVDEGKREERFVGTADVPNFFRKPYGPGWALVGDAGYHKDPVTAQGMTDAFRDAELLVEAIDAGFSGRHHSRKPWRTINGVVTRRRCQCTSTPVNLPAWRRPSCHAATVYRPTGESARDEPAFWYDSRNGLDPGVFLAGEHPADRGGSRERWMRCSQVWGSATDFSGFRTCFRRSVLLSTHNNVGRGYGRAGDDRQRSSRPFL